MLAMTACGVHASTETFAQISLLPQSLRAMLEAFDNLTHIGR